MKPKNTKKTKIEQNQNFTKTAKSHRGQNLNQNYKIGTEILPKKQNLDAKKYESTENEI